MELLVLDTNFESVTIVDSFESLIWTDRYCAYGDFELHLPVNSELISNLKENYYLWLKESQHVMIIEETSIISDTENGDYLVVTGRSLESLLERRIVWEQTTLTGNFQTGIKKLITEAVISPSISDRKISNFIFQDSTDEVVTALTISVQLTGDELYTAIAKLCALNDIGFRITLTDQNQFAFELYAGVDRSYEQLANPFVIFSPNYENIINSNYYTSNTNLRNITLVAGEGEGTDRTTTTVGSGTGLTRREVYTDARDVSSEVDGEALSTSAYLALLYERGEEKLKDYTSVTAFEGEVEATKLFVYGEDFFIGDIVQIANEYGHEGRSYISEIVMSQNEEGITMYPTFQMIQEEGDE